jgi:aspartyl-tRNA(Asn)/glutamyl-tRNA(Gln) amidotransferase subunit C|tara:strand:+ start:607 stop:897 length:291 start_codon:yes stop_codon:yes gene_type:complete
MKVDKELVDKVAELAKLEFNESAKEKMVSDMDKMLAFVDKLEELNTDNIEPLVYMSEETNVLRSDEVHAHEAKDDALKNAPQKDSDYFKVPKVLKK